MRATSHSSVAETGFWPVLVAAGEWLATTAIPWLVGQAASTGIMLAVANVIQGSSSDPSAYQSAADVGERANAIGHAASWHAQADAIADAGNRWQAHAMADRMIAIAYQIPTVLELRAALAAGDARMRELSTPAPESAAPASMTDASTTAGGSPFPWLALALLAGGAALVWRRKR